MGNEKKPGRALPDQKMEDLLDAWMQMSIGIKGNRILKDFSFNEMVACRILYRAEQEGKEITATDLCREMRLLKSQVNKVLTDMEKRGLIYKHRDEQDKRRVFIRMREEGRPVYLAEHAHVMSLIGLICDRLEEQEVDILIEKMGKVVAAMEEIERENYK